MHEDCTCVCVYEWFCTLYGTILIMTILKEKYRYTKILFFFLFSISLSNPYTPSQQRSKVLRSIRPQISGRDKSLLFVNVLHRPPSFSFVSSIENVKLLPFHKTQLVGGLSLTGEQCVHYTVVLSTKVLLEVWCVYIQEREFGGERENNLTNFTPSTGIYSSHL